MSDASGAAVSGIGEARSNTEAREGESTVWRRTKNEPRLLCLVVTVGDGLLNT